LRRRGHTHLQGRCGDRPAIPHRRGGQRRAGAGLEGAYFSRLQWHLPEEGKALRPLATQRDVTFLFELRQYTGGRPGAAQGHAFGEFALWLYEGVGLISLEGNGVALSLCCWSSRLGPDAPARNAPAVAGPVQKWCDQPEAASGHAFGVSVRT